MRDCYCLVVSDVLSFIGTGYGIRGNSIKQLSNQILHVVNQERMTL